jgi:hypothetical protein
MEAVCQEILLCLHQIPSDRSGRVDQGFTALDEFWRSDHNLNTILETSAYIGADRPHDSLDVFVQIDGG